MLKKITLGIGMLLTTGSLVFAQTTSTCGDGNQYYVNNGNDDVIRYFASINEFDVVRISENRVTIEDSVECRYGRDTLVDIMKIEFLDKTVNIAELEIHENTKDLSVNVLRTILFDALLKQIVALGGDPFAEPERETVTTSSNSSNTATIRETTSLSSSVTNTFTPTNTYQPTVPVQNSLFGSTNTYQPTGFVPSYQPVYYPSNTYNYSPYSNSNNGQYYDQYSNTTFNSSQGFTPVGGDSTVVVTWPLSSVGANDIIYFEATDNNNNHHYLGSAMGFQGSDTVIIPSFLMSQSSLTINVRSGSRVIKTVEVSL